MKDIRYDAGSLANDMLATVQEWNSSISDSQDGIVRRVAIDAPSIVVSRLYYELDYSRRIRSLDGFQSILQDSSYISDLASALGTNPSTGRSWTTAEVEAMVSGDLDEFLADFDWITRRVAAKAVGTGRFINTTGDAMTISEGSIVDTRGGIQFETTAGVSAQVPTQHSGGYYYIDLAVRARNAGTGGNVGAGAIRKVQGTLTGVERVNNLSRTTGGLAKESDLSLIARARVARSGLGIPTKNGYYNLIISQDDVLDCVVLMPGDGLAVREGAIDIYVQGRVVQSHSDEWTFQGGNIAMRVQPVTGVATVKVNGVSQVEGVDYEVIESRGGIRVQEPLLSDGRSTYHSSLLTSQQTYGNVEPVGSLYEQREVNAFAGSPRANTQIEFVAGAVPDIGETVDVDYEVNQLIRTLNDLVNNNANYRVCHDVLVKEAVRAEIDMSMKVVLKSGYNEAVVRAAIESALSDYFTGTSTTPGKRIGDSVYQSDIVAVIESVAGVQYVEVPLSQFNRSDAASVVGGSVEASESVVRIGALEHSALGEVTFT